MIVTNELLDRNNLRSKQQAFHECQTAVLDNVRNPTWNQLFEFQMPSSLQDVRLKITVGACSNGVLPNVPVMGSFFM